MSLDTYSNLKNTIVDFAGRDDLTKNIDDFIDLAEEAMFYNKELPLFVRDMETSTQLSTVAGTRTLALPADYLKARKATIVVGGEEIDLNVYSPSALPNIAPSGRPNAYAVTDVLLFDRTPDAVYTINLYYYAKPTPLSSAAPTNAILTKYPSIYLNGSLSFMYDMTGEIDRSENYFQKMLRSIRGAIRADRAGSRSPGGQARVSGSTP